MNHSHGNVHAAVLSPMTMTASIAVVIVVAAVHSHTCDLDSVVVDYAVNDVSVVCVVTMFACPINHSAIRQSCFSSPHPC